MKKFIKDSIYNVAFFLTVTVFCSVMFVINGKCQEVSSNIYEYGEPLTSCESNFRNLFNNWDKKNITNAEDYRLLNYSFVETITDTCIIDLYAKLFTDNNCPVSSTGGSSSSSFFDTVVRHTQHILIRTWKKVYDKAADSQEKTPEIFQKIEKENEQMRTMLKLMISVGDKVYVVFIRDKQQIYPCFVICSPKTNKVILDLVFNNLKVLI
jgi:hypothetical protein